MNPEEPSTHSVADAMAGMGRVASRRPRRRPLSSLAPALTIAMAVAGSAGCARFDPSGPESASDAAGPSADAASPLADADLALPDAGRPDAALPDASLPDAPIPDASSPDAGGPGLCTDVCTTLVTLCGTGDVPTCAVQCSADIADCSPAELAAIETCTGYATCNQVYTCLQVIACLEL